MAWKTYTLTKSGAMTDDIRVHTEFPANWKYFFNEATMTPDSYGEVDKVLQVVQHTVRRGPGDPKPYSRRGHERFYVRYDKRKGSARPGYTIHIGEENALGGGYREYRQFAVDGDLMNLWAYAKAKARFKITLWGPNGWHEEIPAAAQGGTQAVPLVKSGGAAPAPVAAP
jgi:hypothetical protein